jgi:hypothetical protein
MPLTAFEPTIPFFERSKILHALDRVATVIGKNIAHIKLLLSLPSLLVVVIVAG